MHRYSSQPIQLYVLYIFLYRMPLSFEKRDLISKIFCNKLLLGGLHLFFGKSNQMLGLFLKWKSISVCEHLCFFFYRKFNVKWIRHLPRSIDQGSHQWSIDTQVQPKLFPICFSLARHYQCLNDFECRLSKAGNTTNSKMGRNIGDS